VSGARGAASPTSGGGGVAAVGGVGGSAHGASTHGGGGGLSASVHAATSAVRLSMDPTGSAAPGSRFMLGRKLPCFCVAACSVRKGLPSVHISGA